MKNQLSDLYEMEKLYVDLCLTWFGIDTLSYFDQY